MTGKVTQIMRIINRTGITIKVKSKYATRENSLIAKPNPRATIWSKIKFFKPAKLGSKGLAVRLHGANRVLIFKGTEKVFFKKTRIAKQKERQSLSPWEYHHKNVLGTRPIYSIPLF